MKAIKRKINILITFMLVIQMSVFVNAASRNDLQSYSDNENIFIYVPAMEGTVSKIEAQIGNVAHADAKYEAIDGTTKKSIHTTILFDNSLSISQNNREKMKDVARGIINNHAKGERFTLAIFDREIHDLSVGSTDYEQLLVQIDGIEYVNQDTYLKNVLYNAFNRVDSTDMAYQNFVVLSDGSDDNTVGYTYNEIIAGLKDKGFHIISVGSVYQNKINDLEEMFSISRAVDSEYFLLDEIEDVNDIIQEIVNSKPEGIAHIIIPESAMDGSIKSIKVTIKAADNEYIYTTEAQMPFVEIKETQASTEVTQETDELITENITEEIETNPVEETKLEGEEADEKIAVMAFIKENMVICGSCLGGILILILLLVILKSRKKKTMEKDDDDATELKKENDDTVLMHTDEEEDDDSTVMMRKEKTIVLISEEKSSVRYQAVCNEEITIGRKRICKICIENDKAVSGNHCSILCNSYGELVIKDNGSSNGTYLNDEKVREERPLEDGDTLEIGHTRYRLQIVEG